MHATKYCRDLLGPMHPYMNEVLMIKFATQKFRQLRKILDCTVLQPRTKFKSEILYPQGQYYLDEVCNRLRCFRPEENDYVFYSDVTGDFSSCGNKTVRLNS